MFTKATFISTFHCLEKLADAEALLTFVILVRASYLCDVLDEQKALRQDSEENPTSQTTEESDDLDDCNAFMDDVDIHISAE